MKGGAAVRRTSSKMWPPSSMFFHLEPFQLSDMIGEEFVRGTRAKLSEIMRANQTPQKVAKISENLAGRRVCISTILWHTVHTLIFSVFSQFSKDLYSAASLPRLHSKSLFRSVAPASCNQQCWPSAHKLFRRLLPTTSFIPGADGSSLDWVLDKYFGTDREWIGFGYWHHIFQSIGYNRVLSPPHA